MLGDGTRRAYSSRPVEVKITDASIESLSSGSSHTCAVTTVGGVRCWGGNWKGQLGARRIESESVLPVEVMGLSSGVTAVTAGRWHNCALTKESGAMCWGDNYEFRPKEVEGLSTGVVTVSAGGSHTCALTTAGGVKCWGSTGYGQLGDGKTTDGSTPVDIVGLTSGVVAISAGGGHTCALTTEGQVKCWGRNNEGQLGDGTRENRATPVNVIGFTKMGS